MSAQRKKKPARKKLYTLVNWPPSRGPMPKWMTAKREYVIAEPTIEMIDYLPPKDPRRPYAREPAVPLPVVKNAPSPRYAYKRVKRGKHVFAVIDKSKKLPPLPVVPYMVSLAQHVATMATLKPDQWSLACGARSVVYGNVVVHPRGKRRKIVRRALSVAEGLLPSDSTPLVFDLTYPLSKIARVTVQPYHTKIRGQDGKVHVSPPRMSVGYVLWTLARAYKKVYRQHKRYGIWGHAITDLVFEELKIDNNVGFVGIGS